MRHLFANTPSTKSYQLGLGLQQSCFSEDSISMCSLPFIQSPSNIDATSSLEQTTDEHSREINNKQGSKLRLSIDLSKLAEIDDTFVAAPGFDEDTQSADEFKERILNTNLIINRTSFGGKEKRPDPEDYQTLPPKQLLF